MHRYIPRINDKPMKSFILPGLIIFYNVSRKIYITIINNRYKNQRTLFKFYLINITDKAGLYRVVSLILAGSYAVCILEDKAKI